MEEHPPKVQVGEHLPKVPEESSSVCVTRMCCCSSRAESASGSRIKVASLRDRPVLEFGSSRLCLMTLNEGGLELTVGRARAAAKASLEGLGCLFGSEPADDVAAVVVARQEGNDKNLQYWRQALGELGFPILLTEAVHNMYSSIHVFSRDDDSLEAPYDFSLTVSSQLKTGSAAAKGVVAVFVKHLGLTLCLACCHLDGNLVDDHRIAPIPSTIEEACAKTGDEVDAIFIMGDINSTIAPTRKALQEGPIQRSASTLQTELSSAGCCQEEKATFKITGELKQSLITGLSTPAGRARYQAMDGCPAQITATEHFEGGITAVNLVEMPISSFPTYRLCTAEAHTLSKFNKATEDPGVLFMSTSLELQPQDVESLFFGGEKGHSGAIKKRGDMCRLGMGWLDRLYIGTRDVNAVAVQGVPVFLFSEAMKALDHNLIPWAVTLSARP